ncbi:MAG TPA: hypothetical protein VKV02_08905 [Acidobacteriaceae bacterium]|nr:hypothetical protein [Acidobacteriaceae bacterium]
MRGDVTPNTGTYEGMADAAEAALAAEDFATAIAMFDRAEPGVADPDRCAGGRWMAHMLTGNFAGAWLESDAIRQRGRPDPHRFWNGEDLKGKRLIVRSLHGFGDAVQMFRFLPRLRERVADLMIEVPPRLVDLAACFDGVGQVITWGEQAPSSPPSWDVQTEVMELPYVLRVTPDDLRPQQGYLRVPETEQTRVGRIIGPKVTPRVGLIWCAGHWNPTRSIPIGQFRRLLGVEGVEFWSLQGDSERHAWTALGTHPSRRDAHECGEGILPLAAVIERMDLVVTVDTLGAHLAGALGVPCWVLLQRQADWRWMSRRPDSPWYPSLRLLRQQNQDDWAGLIDQVCHDLRTWVQAQQPAGVTSSPNGFASLKA